MHSFVHEAPHGNLTPCISFEFMQNGDLFNYVKKGGRLPDPIVRYYGQQLLEALTEMHRADVCHRDLKLENLVLDSDFNLKVIDFGHACELSGDAGRGFSGDLCGSVGYKAPEIVVGIEYQPQVADLFSLAVTLFMMYTGKQPFFKEASVNDKLYRYFCANSQKTYWEIIENSLTSSFGLCPEFKHLMTHMLAY